jgi:hypothetical protein
MAMKQWIAITLTLVCLSGCHWFRHKPPAVVTSEYVVTGAPAGAIILIDGAPQGEPVEKGRPQIVVSTPGSHLLEVKVSDRVTYSEQTYLNAGEQQAIRVLSGH